MRLVTATYHKYSRLDLATLPDPFTITFDKQVVIVGGDNGGGKSSLLQSFFPYIIDKGSIHKGGHVTRTWNHEGVEYIDVTTDAHYEMYKLTGTSRENINPAGLLKVQKSIYKELLGVDDSLFKVLTGMDTFTGMNTTARMKWLNLLSDNHLDYVMDLWGQVKRDILDQKAIVKHHSSRIEKLSVSTPDEDIEEQIALIQGKVESLSVKLTENTELSSIDMDSQLTALERQYKRHTRVLKYLRSHPHYTEEAIDKVNQDLSVLKGELTGVTNQILELPTYAEDTEDVDIDTCVRTIEHLEKQCVDTGLTGDGVAMLATLEGLTLDIDEVLHHVVEDITLGRYDEVYASVSQLLEEGNQCTVRITALETRDAVLESKRLTTSTCPKCDTIHSVNYDEVVHTQVKDKIVSVKQRRDRLRIEYTDMQEELGIINAGKKAKEQLSQFAVSYPQLSTLWTAMADAYPGVLPMRKALSAYHENLQHYIQTSKIQEEIQQLTDLLTYQRTVQSKTYKQDQLQRHLLEKKEIALNQQYAILEAEKSAMDVYTQQVTLHHTTSLSITELMNGIIDHVNSIKMSNTNDAIKVSIEEYTHNLNDLRKHLHTFKVMSGIKEDATAAMNKAKAQMETAKITAQTLSPKTGLISHLYRTVLLGYLQYVNSHLAIIWDYPLILSLKDSGIDYKFPLWVDGKKRDDISLGSKGMREGINMLIMMLSRQRLKLEHAPLILDEFGDALDDAHRENAYRWITKQTNSQVFIVSHSATLMTHFDDSQADFVLLRSNNIDMGLLPPSVNEIIS